MSGIQVRVKNLADGKFGYYDDKRRRPGDVFFIKSEIEFSNKWMEKVDENPEPKKPKVQQITGDPKTRLPVEREAKRGTRKKPSRDDMDVTDGDSTSTGLSEEVI